MTRDQAWRAIWQEAEYVRLDARKDVLLKQWNVLDAYKNHPRLAEPEKLAEVNAALDRAIKQCAAFEKEFFQARGLKL